MRKILTLIIIMFCTICFAEEQIAKESAEEEPGVEFIMNKIKVIYNNGIITACGDYTHVLREEGKDFEIYLMRISVLELAVLKAKGCKKGWVGVSYVVEEYYGGNIKCIDQSE